MATEERVTRTEQEWREQLTPEQFEVLRGRGTERAFAGALVDIEEPGVYRCAGCGAELFRSDAKYHSHSGWPSFSEPAVQAAVESSTDTSHGMERTEVHCRRCGGHLGHIFPDGPEPTGTRYCVNSLSLDFEPSGDGGAR